MPLGAPRDDTNMDRCSMTSDDAGRPNPTARLLSLLEALMLVLREAGRPLAMKELLDTAHALVPARSRQTLRNRVNESQDITRVGHDAYAPTSLGLAPYTSLGNEMVASITRNGPMRLPDLIKTMSERGASAKSVTTYAHAANCFTIQDGLIVLQTVSEYLESVPPPRDGPRLRLIDGRWTAVCVINARHFKGYSFPVPPAWAKHHGFTPEQNATVEVLDHDPAASLTWSIYGLNDPMIGRLRTLLEQRGAAVGQTILFTLDADDQLATSIEG
jgi:hypothetical protein